MKKLSIEEKAQRYDEAIEKLRDFYRDYDTVSRLIDVKEELANLIPELKESEDEEIRKALIKMVYDISSDGLWVAYNIHKEDTLAWLKKQINKDEEILVLKDQIESLLAAREALKEAHKIELEKQGEQKPYGQRQECVDCQFNYTGECKGSCAIRRDEQKPTDKVEPKFKIGDKIVEKDFGECSCGTIIDIKDGKYIFDGGGFICIEEQGLWKLVKQKPAWSEEDEEQAYKILELLEESKKNYIYTGGIENSIRWFKEILKSLKDRMYEKNTKTNCTYQQN